MFILLNTNFKNNKIIINSGKAKTLVITALDEDSNTINKLIIDTDTRKVKRITSMSIDDITKEYFSICAEIDGNFDNKAIQYLCSSYDVSSAQLKAQIASNRQKYINEH